jgi:hypothetical protein
MDVDHARAIALATHRGVWTLDDEPLLSHVERVAAAVPGWARAVAWLHEVLERSDMPEEALLREGVSSEQLRALRLLSRDETSSDLVYLAHIDLIARAAGVSGRLARAVKLADLEDRSSHPLERSNGWAPPYASALNMLHEDAPAARREVA